MTPVSPSIPGHESEEIVMAKGQPEYIPLPALPIQCGNNENWTGLLTRWKLTDEERAAVAAGADLWLSVLTFDRPLQPVMLSVECPLDEALPVT